MVAPRIVGARFVLDLMVHSGTNNITAQQSYLTFTTSILKNGRVSDIPTTCTLTSTVTPDIFHLRCCSAK